MPRQGNAAPGPGTIKPEAHILVDSRPLSPLTQQFATQAAQAAQAAAGGSNPMVTTYVTPEVAEVLQAGPGSMAEPLSATASTPSSSGGYQYQDNAWDPSAAQGVSFPGSSFLPEPLVESIVEDAPDNRRKLFLGLGFLAVLGAVAGAFTIGQKRRRAS